MAEGETLQGIELKFEFQYCFCVAEFIATFWHHYLILTTRLFGTLEIQNFQVFDTDFDPRKHMQQHYFIYKLYY